MEKSFFEMLAIADQERIHTQTIAWFLDPESLGIKHEDKSKLIKQLFGLSIPANKIKEIKVITELNSLDLALIYHDDFVVLENKLKSKEGIGQTNKYNQTVDYLKKRFHCKNTPKKFFLSFSGESANSEGWHYIDYNLVYTALTSIKTDNIYAKDYTILLHKLIAARNIFLTNHTKFKEVFNRSGMKAEDRFEKPLESSDDTVKFICGNKLERIFIETLFRKILGISGISEANISESHGTALIQLDIFQFIAKENNQIFKVGIQLQGDALKYVLSSTNYHSSVKDELPASLISELTPIFSSIGLKSNSGRTKAYHSWSRKISNAERLENSEINTFCDWFKKQANESKEFWNKYLSVLEAQNKLSELKLYNSS